MLFRQRGALTLSPSLSPFEGERSLRSTAAPTISPLAP